MTEPMQVMTPDEFRKAMEAIYGSDDQYDPECCHSAADGLMCQLLRALGYGDGIEIFVNATRWYA